MKSPLNLKICNSCVMDTSSSSISFDEKNICIYCNNFKKTILPFLTIPNKNIYFENLVNKIQANNSDFSCIVGMSGGIDSSFLLHKLVVDYNLRPLVFHVDAGWNSQIAVNNIESLVDKLKLDLFTEVIDWEEMKSLQLAYFKSGVPHIDVPQDHAFFATMYKFAAKHNIKYIFSGGNYSTECVRNPVEWMYYQSDSIQLKDIYKKHGKGKLNNFPITNILWHKIYLPYVKGIKLIRPLDYFEYNKEEATQLLEDLYGYQRYPQKHFESRFTRFYESFWLPERFGYDTRKVQYSSLILTGQMSREEALEKLRFPAYTKEQINEDFEFISNKLGITVDELWSYFYLPKKTYKDYKSQESVYKLGSSVMRLFGLEKGGKR